MKPSRYNVLYWEKGGSIRASNGLVVLRKGRIAATGTPSEVHSWLHPR